MNLRIFRVATTAMASAWLGCAMPSADGAVDFVTETAPVDAGTATALVSDGANLWLFRRDDGRLLRSVSAVTGSWTEVAPATSMADTEPGEMYGGCAAWWANGGRLIVSRWRDNTLPGPNPWDRERAAFYDPATDAWAIRGAPDSDEFNTSLQVIGDTLYALQHAGGAPIRRVDLAQTFADDGAGLTGLSGDNPTWLSRVAKFAPVGDRFYGIKNDWETDPAGTGDLLYSWDPADYAPNTAIEVVELAPLPFEPGRGCAVIGLPPFWTEAIGADGGLFIIAGNSPSNHEGDGDPSDQYLLYDIESAVMTPGMLPGVTGAGASAVLHGDRIYIKRGFDGVVSSDELWVVDGGGVPTPFLMTSIAPVTGGGVRIEWDPRDPALYTVEKAAAAGAAWGPITGVISDPFYEDPAAAAEDRAVYRVAWTTEAPPIFTDNFETGAPGWTVGGEPTDNWELGTPSTYTDPQGDHGPNAAVSGANCWATGLSEPYETGTVEGSDVATLTSAEIDLTAEASALLSFQSWRETEADFDFIRLDVVDAGTGAVLGSVMEETGIDPVWREKRLSLDAWTGRAIRLRFVLVSDDSVAEAGWYIDDVVVARN